MRKFLAIILSVALLCSCNKNDKNNITVPNTSDKTLPISENTNNEFNPNNYSAEKINMDDWYQYNDFKYDGKHLYAFATYDPNFQNQHFVCYDINNDTKTMISGTYNVISDIIYSDNEYYTIEYDEENNSFICLYETDGKKLKASIKAEDFGELKKSGDNIYYITNSTATLYDKELNEIHNIDLGQYIDYSFEGSVNAVTSDKNGNIYIMLYDKFSVSYTLIKINYDGSLAYKNNNFSDLPGTSSYEMSFFINEDKLFISCPEEIQGDKIQFLNIVDISSGETIERYEIENAEKISDCYGNYDISITDKDNIYGLNLSTQERTILYNTSKECTQSNSELSWIYNWTFDNKDLILLTQESENYGDAILITDSNFNIINTSWEINTQSAHSLFFYNNEIYGVTNDYEPEKLNIIKSSDTKNFSEILTNLDIGNHSGILDFWTDKENNYWFVCYNDDLNLCVRMCNSEGKLINNEILPIYQYGYNFHRTSPDGEIIFYSDEKNNICSLNLDKNMNTEKLYPSNLYYTLFDTSLNHDSEIFAYNRETNIINIFDLSSYKMKELFNLDKLPITDITEFVQISDTEYILCAKDGYNNEIIYKITLTDKQSTVLTVAGYNIPLFFKEAMSDFSNANSNIDIICKDYAKNDYSDGNSYFTGYEKLDEAIVSKNVPDIIITDPHFDYEKYEDLFLDLTEYKNDYKDKYYDYAFKISDTGKTTQIIPFLYSLSGFDIPGNKEFFENNDLKNLIDYLNNNTENISFQSSWTDILLDLYINENIDFKNKKCNFDTDTFKDILEFIKFTENKKSEIQDSDYDYTEMQSQISSGTFDPKYSDIQCYAGVPGASFIIDDYNGFGIYEMSDKKELALEFISYIMQSDFQKNILDKDEDIISTNKELLETSLKYRLNPSDNPDYFSKQENKKLLEDILSLFDKNVIFSNQNTRIYSIAEEEIHRFLNENLTVKETVENIQNKCRLYLSES
ncbi:MAG: carbohydrate ABC transporter substrate-binding protein [Ruminococcus sp.]|nr:carbohydrate ABC transporter substrate-binding protein [Ruminococcus sp.]